MIQNSKLKGLLEELRSGLQSIYGHRLRGLYLFGSYARGDQDSESDVDVLVVLDDFTSYFAEVRRAGPLGAELSLKYEVSISKVFMREEAWLHKETPFLLNVRHEAVAA